MMGVEDAELRECVLALARGLGSCVWVLNNRHNSETLLWNELAEAALRDARLALDSPYVRPTSPRA